LCSFDPAQIGATAGGTANVTVVVHDTFNQSDDETEGFDSVQTPPVASIAAPSPDGTTFLPDETIILSGAALDAEQGHLTGDALTWDDGAGGLIDELNAPKHGEHVFLDPPDPAVGWTPGPYTITLTATDGTNTSTDTVTIQILVDGDHDGIPFDDDVATCPAVPGSGDTDSSNVTADPDLDGIPNHDDQYTEGGPCGAQTTYNAIIDFEPNDLQRNTSGTPITVKVRIAYRPVSQTVGSTVKISKVVYENEDGDVVEESYTQFATSWSAKGQEGNAKFDRQAFIAFLNHADRQIANQRIVVEVSGNFSGSPAASWAGRDSTNVK
jgi:hypothetical protein